MSQLKAALAALETIKGIAPPYGDIDGDAINSSSVLERLDSALAEQVSSNVQAIADYITGIDGRPNQRAINTLNRKGYRTSYSCEATDQYGPVGCSGRVEVGRWHVELRGDASDE